INITKNEDVCATRYSLDLSQKRMVAFLQLIRQHHNAAYAKQRALKQQISEQQKALNKSRMLKFEEEKKGHYHKKCLFRYVCQWVKFFLRILWKYTLKYIRFRRTCYAYFFNNGR